MKMNGVLIGLLAAGIGAYLLLKDKTGATNVAETPEQKRQAIIDYLQTNATETPETIARVTQVFQSMSNDEVTIVYSFLFDYVAKGISPEPGPFLDEVSAIARKYDIFS